MTDTGRNLRVVFVCNSAWYAWNFRAGTIRALRARDVSVVVIAPPDSAASRLSGIDGVTFLPWRLSIDGQNPFQEALSFISLIRHLFKIRPTLIFSFTIKANIYSGIACWLLRIPFAPNVTGLGMAIHSKQLKGRLVGWLYANSLSRATRLFIQNSNDLDVLRSLGLSTSVPVTTLKGSGVDLAQFIFRPMPWASPRHFVFIGRLQADKGVRDFVEAARHLRRMGIDAHFTIVGGTSHANASAISQAELDEWHQENIVALVGEQDDVRPWLWGAHALVLPSHGGEGIPRVILEAAAVGRPAIVSDVPGCRDVVVDHDTGLVCAVRDLNSLVATIREFVEMSPNGIAEMGRRARCLAVTAFSEDRAINAYLDCLPPSRSSCI